MPVIINCPNCQKKLRVPDTLLGRAVKCSSCGTAFTATANEVPPEEERPLPSAAQEEARATERVPADSRRSDRPAQDYEPWDEDDEEERDRLRGKNDLTKEV
jgi:predicted Zn finger-like uncharacterized protein